jgi:putative endonuclease
MYIGFTTNLERRIVEHNTGKSKATKGRRPFLLIYCEYHHSIIDATRREDYFKTNPGKKALKLMLRDTFNKLK